MADEVLVVPTRALRAEDKDYAVAFAVPGDWDGLKQVVTIHNLRSESTSSAALCRARPTPT